MGSITPSAHFSHLQFSHQFQLLAVSSILKRKTRFLYIYKKIARGFKRLGRIVFFIKKTIKYHILLLLDWYKVCVGA
jgi:hypothetical protein